MERKIQNRRALRDVRRFYKGGRKKYVRRMVSRVPFGYKKTDSGDGLELNLDLVLCELSGEEWSEAALARYLIENYLLWRSLRKALRDYNARFGFVFDGQSTQYCHYYMSAAKFSEWLNHPILQGFLYVMGRLVNIHERLISTCEYRLIRSYFMENKKLSGGARCAKLLTGVVLCSECSITMRVVSSRRMLSNRQGLGGTFVQTGHLLRSYKCWGYRNCGCPVNNRIDLREVERTVFLKLTTNAEKLFGYLLMQSEETESEKKMRSQLDGLLKIPEPCGYLKEAIQKMKAELLIAEVDKNVLCKKINEDKASLVQVFSTLEFWCDFLPTELPERDYRNLMRRLIAAVWITDGEVAAVDYAVDLPWT